MNTIESLLSLLDNLHAACHAPPSVSDEEAFAAFDAASDAIWAVAPAWFKEAFIAHGSDRKDAIGKMSTALASTKLSPIVTNTSFLKAIIASDEFANGQCDTGFAEPFAKKWAAAKP